MDRNAMLRCKSRTIGRDDEQKTAELRHVTTLRVKATFSPVKTDHDPLLTGTHRYARQLFDKNGPLQSLPTKPLNHPDPLQMWRNL
jgi:hypothetical protein